MAKETLKAKTETADKGTPKAKTVTADKETQMAESAGGGKIPVMFSASVDMAHSRKYGFDGTGVCKVTAKIVAVPPPSAFLEWVQDTLVGAKD